MEKVLSFDELLQVGIKNRVVCESGSQGSLLPDGFLVFSLIRSKVVWIWNGNGNGYGYLNGDGIGTENHNSPKFEGGSECRNIHKSIMGTGNNNC